MSDQPSNPTPPPSPNRGPGESAGFNWRLLGLLSIALIILGIAFFNPVMSSNIESLTYSQFRKAWDQGRVVVDNNEKPLKVVTTDTSSDATITGWITPELVRPENPDIKRTDFQVVIDPSLNTELRQLVGEGIKIENTTALPVEGAIETLSFADFRKSLALNEINTTDAGNPLRILSSKDATILVGTREIVTNLVPRKDAQGKPQLDRQFRVPVSGTILKD